MADSTASPASLEARFPRAPSLSALVVARNEEARLGPCLDRLAFADEIVVLLDRTTDASAAIARAYRARVVEGAWVDEPARRNAGIENCTGDWVLEVDCDEWVTEALAAEIRAALATARDGYFIVPMANHIGERLVRHGWGAYNGIGAKPILFRRGMKKWGKGRVHPPLDLQGERQRLAEPMLHFVYRDLSDMLARLDRYTDLAAQDAIESGAPMRLSTALRRMLSRAWKSLVARRGYREGAYGVALALYSALYPMLIYLKVRIPAARPGQEGEPRA
ncbi:MAG TPA: glycosyltransferase family 2 protein [Stellaceae bacterium]|nr:glycosyltransferase family 2 protein [Stellaceae bacterium]